MLLQQEVTEFLFETVDFAEYRELVEIGLQLGLLVGLEIVTMAVVSSKALPHGTDRTVFITLGDPQGPSDRLGGLPYFRQ
jgi:hypothetical protein